MPARIVIGLQWGDEGKGKITDYLAEDADLIVRYQGGNNAGHTVVVGSEKFKLHLIPSGILHPGKGCILGNGMVIDLGALVSEIEGLRARKVSFDNLMISPKAHLIMPYHIFLDSEEEVQRKERKIGTTGRGIGPAYRDKVDRCGIQIGDLFSQELFQEKVGMNLEKKKLGSKFSVSEIVKSCSDHFQIIREFVKPVNGILHDHLIHGKNILLEGAQGTLLDLDHGTYPYVTSSYPTSGGACLGSGIGPGSIKAVIGVVKAYSTRVGEGPFTTELRDDLGDALREIGHEYGTTTGRPRRTGWLDLVALKYAVQINGVTEIALTKLDILCGITPLKVATGYRIGERIQTEFPEIGGMLQQSTPIYEEIPGFKDLKRESEFYYNQYIGFIEKFLGVPVTIVSYGEKRDETFIRKEKEAGVAQR
ncbi:MAG: adenylosuccinate synthase [Candidatus Wallbacteria bacterium]|nr:adenylosuccinate synthase [Candidatus Wallbacteria bacterium]